MKRQRKNARNPTILYNPLTDNDESFQLDRLTEEAPGQQPHRFENTIEAKVEENDTLAALALRFNTTVSEIKRLNKIDKENEIHARKIVKIPLTVHSVLLDTLPKVHKSGNNSPRQTAATTSSIEEGSSEYAVRCPLKENNILFGEKLLVASVNSAEHTKENPNTVINNLYINSNGNVGSSSSQIEDLLSSPSDSATVPLISDILDEHDNKLLLNVRPIRGPALLQAIDWSGADCDMSWACLFILILVLCFVIPLIYVIYLAEHPHHHPHNNSTP